MNMEDVARAFEMRVRNVCKTQSRYRVLWVVGEPLVGKTTLCQHVCKHQRWRYINFTLDVGFFDSLIGREETYRPVDFLADLFNWCASTIEELIVFDEIEPLLGLWNWDQQELFFRLIGREPSLKTGVVLVTHTRTAQQLCATLSDMSQDHVYEITQGVML